MMSLYREEIMTGKDEQTPLNELAKKLDRLTELVENLLILEGVKMGADKQRLRKLVSVDMNRVTRVSGLLKEKRDRQSSLTQ